MDNTYSFMDDSIVKMCMTMNERIAQAFFSANLYQCRPDLDWESHDVYYGEFREYHRPVQVAAVPGPGLSADWATEMAEPGILALFHLGDHAVMPPWLLGMGFRFDILLSRSVYGRFGGLFEAMGQDVRFWFAEDPQVLWRLKQVLAEGKHVLVFADGQAGTEGQEGRNGQSGTDGQAATESRTRKAGRVPVPFFATEVWVRQGIGFMSHVFNVPVYLLVNQGTTCAPVLTGHTAIRPVAGLGREIYVRETMVRLYAGLEARLENRLIHWAGWLDMHRQGMLRPAIQPSAGRPDTQCPWMVRLALGEREIWFDKKHYRAWPVK